MPELPEVETISLQLNSVLKGLRILEIKVLTPKSFLGDKVDVLGLKVLGAERRAKIIIVKLEKDKYLAVHLKLTGQLIFQEAVKVKKNPVCEKNGPFAVCELPNKYTRVITIFNNGAKLYFNDLRIFGWIKVLKDLRELKVEKLGPEANDKHSFSLDYFQKICQKTRKPIKIVIMDQEKLAGIGNIYANEALFAAGIMPTRSANDLSRSEISKLRDFILKVLSEAIKHKGSSDKDEAYRQITGEKGSYQNYLQVYGKAGQKCPGGKGIIKRIVLGGRGTYFCSACQK